MENDKFIKLKKSEKLAMEPSLELKIKGVKIALFIPLARKMDRYRACAFFVQKDGLWYRMPDYDCFRFIQSPYVLKGDFENDGIQFFLGEGWSTEYEGHFTYDNTPPGDGTV